MKRLLIVGCVLPVGEYPLPIIRVDGSLPVHAQRLFKAQSRDSLIRGVRVYATALLVGDQNSQRGSIAHRPEAGFTDRQRIQGHLAGDNVTQGPREPV